MLIMCNPLPDMFLPHGIYMCYVSCQLSVGWRGKDANFYGNQKEVSTFAWGTRCQPWLLIVLDRLLIVLGRHLHPPQNVNRPPLGQEPDSITDVNKMLGVEVGLETLLAIPGPLHSNQAHRGDCTVKQARSQASPGNEMFRAMLLSHWP